MPEDEEPPEFWTMKGPNGSVEVHTCPECDYTAMADDVRENGGCLLDRCDYELDEEAVADA